MKYYIKRMEPYTNTKYSHPKVKNLQTVRDLTNSNSQELDTKKNTTATIKENQGGYCSMNRQDIVQEMPLTLLTTN